MKNIAFIKDIVWGAPLIMILVFSHIYFTVRFKFIQRYTFKGIKYSLTPDKTSSGVGTYSAFAAALGTTIGPGNIVGVALAISVGGPGSIFWMWLCGVLAIATKYAESYLAIKYRQKDGEGGYTGGVMYILKKLGHIKTAKFWAWLCLIVGLGMGCMVPANSLSVMLESQYAIPGWITGAVLAFMVALVIVCGFKGISKVCDFLVPIMSIGFMICCLCVIALNYNKIFDSFLLIFKGAFMPASIAGGGLGAAIKSGITRGLYSNESGMGSGAVLAAQAGDDNIEMSALAASTTTFWDTVVMCVVTAIAFICSGAYYDSNTGNMAYKAFSTLPYGDIFLSLAMAMFVFATIIGWYCIAGRAVEFLFKTQLLYKICYIIFIFWGAILNVSAVWDFADIANAIMIVPSLYCLFKLKRDITFKIT